MPYLEGRKWLLRFGVLHHLFLEEGEPPDLCNGGKSEASPQPTHSFNYNPDISKHRGQNWPKRQARN